jgi:cell wall-associated NlpC family hydrolase
MLVAAYLYTPPLPVSRSRMSRRFPHTPHLRFNATRTAAVAVLVAAIASGCASSRPLDRTPAKVAEKPNAVPTVVPDAPADAMPDVVMDSEPAPRWDIPDWTWSVEQRIREEVDEWFGTPYRMGGNDKNGVDCSAFVLAIYQDLFGVQIPRTTSTQVTIGEQVSPEELQPGDLVFFRPSRSQHVGIYLRDGEFAHASASEGVTISRLDETYWDRAYWTSRRLFDGAPAVAKASLWEDSELYMPAPSLPASAHAETDTLNASRSGW